MSKEQYNSIDDWFREAAEQLGPPVNDAAWQAMEAKLDGQKKRRRAIFWWWFGGLFLAGGIFMLARMNYEFNDNQSWPNSELPSKTQIVKKEKKSGTQASRPSDPTTGIVGKEKADRSSVVSTGGEITTKDQAKGSKPANVPVPENERISTTGIINTNKENSSNVSKENSAIYRNKKSSIHKTVPPHILAGTSVAVASSPEKNVETDNDIISEQAEGATIDSLASDSSLLKKENPVQSIVASTDSASPKKAAKSPGKPTHFYIFGALAPEWSYVKSRGSGDVSLSYGLGVGYSFSKKWAIQAGVFLAGKKYVAGEGDYTPKKGSYYDNPYIKIESVDADCSVLEIPISMRYTFLEKKKLKFFAIAGIASTVMKEENYAYDYTRSGNPAYSHYTYKTGEFSWFSTASFSVGLERPVNKHFSLLFAPYFNFPLNGIGEGKVYINSFGIQGGLKYNLPF